MAEWSLSPLPLRNAGAKKLLRIRRAGQSEAERSRGVEGKAEILLVQPDPEAGGEIRQNDALADTRVDHLGRSDLC